MRSKSAHARGEPNDLKDTFPFTITIGFKSV